MDFVLELLKGMWERASNPWQRAGILFAATFLILLLLIATAGAIGFSNEVRYYRIELLGIAAVAALLVGIGYSLFVQRHDLKEALFPKPAELPSELQRAIENPSVGVRSGAVSELERLFHGSDKSLALAARKALMILTRDNNRRVSTAAAAALGVTVKPTPVHTPPPEVKQSKPVSTPRRKPQAKLTPAPVRTPPSEVKKPKPVLALRREPPPKPDTFTITSPIRLELVRVPAGEFLMGSDPAKDKDAVGEEQPQHRVHVPEFYIAKTPLTNAQYATFVKGTKHSLPNHWEKGKIPSGKENHPVIYVSWVDATTFCKWLSQETGQSFRLPSEAEWEKAARSTDGRIYPWGDKPLTPELCNFGRNVGDTTPVGQYSPQGDSPYGCADMLGNVFEWTLRSFKGYPYQADDRSGRISDSVLRGGSFYSLQRYVRCACRRKEMLYNRFGGGGFRVVVPFSHLSGA